MKHVILIAVLTVCAQAHAAECENLNGDVVARKYAEGEFLIGTPADSGMYIGVLHSKEVKTKVKAQIGFNLWVKKNGTQVIATKNSSGFETKTKLDVFLPAPECSKEVGTTHLSGVAERKNNATSCPAGAKFVSSPGATWVEEYCELPPNQEGQVFRHGKFTTWYDGNRKGQEGTYDHDQKVGVWRDYEIAGRTKGYVGCELTYAAPEIKKLQKCFFPSGKVKSISTFTEQGAEAVDTTYNEKGQKVEVDDHVNNTHERLRD
jgi:hypothetical protein